MPLSPGSAVHAFTRRVAASSFVLGTLQSVAVLATAAAASLLIARLAGTAIAPSRWWALGALPVLACGWWRARRERIAPAEAAVHLDRRLQLGGLLLVAHEGIALEPAWRQQLDAGLAALPQVLPPLRWLQWARWPALAALLLAAIAWLPQPGPAPAAPPSFAAAAALEQLQDELDELLQNPELPPEVGKELTQQLERLQQQNRDAAPTDWRELDALQQRLQREQLLAAAAEAAAAAASGAAAGAFDPAALAKAAAALREAGALDALSPLAKGLLQRAMDAAGRIDPSQLPLDAKSLQQLAEAMQGAVEQLAAAAGQAGAGEAGAAGKLTREQLADLRELVAGACNGAGKQGAAGQGRGNGNGNGNGAGEGRAAGGAGSRAGSVGNEGDGAAGSGGIARGPGRAALNLTQDTQGDADQSLVLPPGAAVPDQWVPIGSQIAVPDVQPVANQGAGGQGQQGQGGASWQLQLAPRHRQVVQRYFPAGTGAGNGDKR